VPMSGLPVKIFDGSETRAVAAVPQPD
jgi:hypothetical protein